MQYYHQYDHCIDLGLSLGEGAIWSVQHQCFFFVDIKGNLIGMLDPLGNRVTKIILNDHPSAIIPADDGRMLVACRGRIGLLDIACNSFQTIALIEPELQNNRCNDGKCDSCGRFWFGTMDMCARVGKGALYRFDGMLHKILPDLTIPNGICWSVDDQMMYHVDSFNKVIRGYHFHPGSGTISESGMMIRFQGDGLPDGMAIDEQGMLWVAMWDGFSVDRYDPITGRLLARVVLPAPRITSCAFGGENMTLLMVTSASTGLSEDMLKNYPLSGSIFLIETGIRGTQTYSYRVRTN